MPTLALDRFTFSAGTSLAGHVADIGGTWSANLATLGDAINWDGSKLGSKNALPNSSAYFGLPVVTGTNNYGARATFTVGDNLVFDSIGIMIRLQHVTAGEPNFMYFTYNGSARTWDLWVNTLSFTQTVTFAMTMAAGETHTIDILWTDPDTLTGSVDGVVVCTITNPALPGVFTANGFPGVISPNASPGFTETAGWWIDDYIVYTDAPSTDVMDFGLYFAGSGTLTGEDFSPIQYGLRTPVIIDGAQAGFEYAIPVKPVDLAGFLNSRMGNVKLRRSGADPQSTTPAVLRAIAIKYKKSQPT